MRIIYLLFTVLFAIEVSGQVAIARLKFEDAEEAFNKGDYTTTISKLEDAEKLFGKINVPILHLRIITQDKLLQKKLDFTILSALRKNCSQFLKDYETMEGIEEKYRQVYKIQEAYAKHPNTIGEYEKLVAEKKAEEERIKIEAEKNKPVITNVYRATGLAASAVKFAFFVNGVYVGALGNNTRFVLPLPPGTYYFACQSEGDFSMPNRVPSLGLKSYPITIVSGQPAHLKVDFKGLKWGDIEVSTVEGKEQNKLMDKCTFLGNQSINLNAIKKSFY